jgi:hypothetical protein
VQDYSGQVDLHWGSHAGAADLFAPAGTPVVAAMGGTVTDAGYSKIGGNYVQIQGQDGNQYYYAHLQDTPLVKAGQQVGPGAQLGGVGDTGNAKGTGTHLHFGAGPSILEGTGPAGGAGGGGFDAVGHLRAALAGPVPPDATQAVDLHAYARGAASRAGIDPATFERQIQQESGFNPVARNPSGATGIAQIVPQWHPGVDPTDPIASLDYAANLMAANVHKYGSYATALAAYNAGPGAVAQYGGVPPFPETQRYIAAILPGGKEPPVSTPVHPSSPDLLALTQAAAANTNAVPPYQPPPSPYPRYQPPPPRPIPPPPAPAPALGATAYGLENDPTLGQSSYDQPYAAPYIGPPPPPAALPPGALSQRPLAGGVTETTYPNMISVRPGGPSPSLPPAAPPPPLIPAGQPGGFGSPTGDADQGLGLTPPPPAPLPVRIATGVGEFLGHLGRAGFGQKSPEQVAAERAAQQAALQQEWNTPVDLSPGGILARVPGVLGAGSPMETQANVYGEIAAAPIQAIRTAGRVQEWDVAHRGPLGLTPLDVAEGVVNLLLPGPDVFLAEGPRVAAALDRATVTRQGAVRAAAQQAYETSIRQTDDLQRATDEAIAAGRAADEAARAGRQWAPPRQTYERIPQLEVAQEELSRAPQVSGDVLGSERALSAPYSPAQLPGARPGIPGQDIPLGGAPRGWTPPVIESGGRPAYPQLEAGNPARVQLEQAARSLDEQATRAASLGDTNQELALRRQAAAARAVPEVPGPVTPAPGAAASPSPLDGVKLYHGTTSNVTNPRDLRAVTAEQWGKAVYFATNPEIPTTVHGDGGHVIEAYADLQKPLLVGSEEYRQLAGVVNQEVEANWQRIQDLELNGDLRAADELRARTPPLDDQEPAWGAYFAERARAQGYDAIIDPASREYGHEVAVLNPERLLTPEEAAGRGAAPSAAPTPTAPTAPQPDVAAEIERLRGENARLRGGTVAPAMEPPPAPVTPPATGAPPVAAPTPRDVKIVKQYGVNGGRRFAATEIAGERIDVPTRGPADGSAPNAWGDLHPTTETRAAEIKRKAVELWNARTAPSPNGERVLGSLGGAATSQAGTDEQTTPEERLKRGVAGLGAGIFGFRAARRVPFTIKNPSTPGGQTLARTVGMWEKNPFASLGRKLRALPDQIEQKGLDDFMAGNKVSDPAEVALAYYRWRGGPEAARLEQWAKPVFDAVRDLQTPFNAYVKLQRDLEVANLARFGGVRNAAAGIKTAEDAQAALTELEQSVGPATWKRLQDADQLRADAFTQLLDDRVAAGTLPQEVADALKDTQPHYNPTRLDEAADLFDRMGKNFSVRNAGLRKLSETGHEADTLPPLVTFVQGLREGEASLQKNGAVSTLIDELLQHQPGQITRDKGPHLPGEVAGTISRMKDGVREVYRVDPGIERMVKNMGAEQVGAFGKVMGALNLPLKLGSTVFSPYFPIGNIIRDTAAAYISSGPGATVRAPGAFLHALRGDAQVKALEHLGKSAAQIADELQRGGGIYIRNLGDLKQFIPDLVSAGLGGGQAALTGDPNDPNYGRDIALRAGAFAGGRRALERVNRASEMGTRLAIYQNELSKGKTSQMAGFAAGRGTLDFSRMGEWVRAANPAVAFLGAQVGGAMQPLRTLNPFTPGPGRTTRDVLGAQARAGSLVAAAIGAYLWNRQNPEAYAEISQQEKDNFFTLLLPGATKEKPLHIALNMSEFAPLIGPVTAALAHYDQTDPRSFAAMAADFARSYTPGVPKGEVAGGLPGLLPGVVKGPFENQVNTDFFTGRPIVSRRLEGLPPSEQVGPRTSALATSAAAQKLTELTGIAPLQLDHLIAATFGTAGQAFLDTSSLGTARQQEGLPPPLKGAVGRVLRDYPGEVEQQKWQRYDDLYRQLNSRAVDLVRNNPAFARSTPDQQTSMLRSANLELQDALKTQVGISAPVRDLGLPPRYRGVAAGSARETQIAHALSLPENRRNPSQRALARQYEGQANPAYTAELARRSATRQSIQSQVGQLAAGGR